MMKLPSMLLKNLIKSNQIICFLIVIKVDSISLSAKKKGKEMKEAINVLLMERYRCHLIGTLFKYCDGVYYDNDIVIDA